MCNAPDIEEPQRLQQSREPVFSTNTSSQSRTGRRGTILTGSGSTSEMQPVTAGGKKTLLGS